MKTSNLKHVFPVAGKTIEKYEREANASMFNASGSGFSSDSNFNATGGATSTQEPYQIKVTNSGVVAGVAEIFGAYKNLNVTRFGSTEDVTVSMASTAVSYAQMLNQSANQPFEVVLTRIECSDQEQLRAPIQLNWQDASGETKGRSIVVSSYNSPDQFSDSMIDVKQSYRIDGNTSMSYGIKAGTTVNMSLFVSAQVNIAKPLSGQAPIEEFTSQRVRTFAN